MIGKRLEQLRKSKVISQRQLALRIGLASTTISRYERNLFTPREEVLTRLANFFEVDIKIFDQAVAGALSSIRYVPNRSNGLPLKVKHKLEADLQTQVECWETFEDLVGKNETGLELSEHPFFKAIAIPSQICKLAATTRKVWLDLDDATEDLTAFMEQLGYRILISSECDSRFAGLLAQTRDNDYFVISTAWSDEERRHNLAKMLGMRLLLTQSSISPTMSCLKSFADALLKVTSESTRAPKYNESTPKFGINIPMPDLGSHFANLVNNAWRAGKISTQTAISLLRSTESDLREMRTPSLKLTR